MAFTYGCAGWGGLTHIYPGEDTALRGTATKASCFSCHCAPGGATILYHVTHGMNEAVMVLPHEGLTDKDGNQLMYDSIAYIGEQDFYLPTDDEGEYRSYCAAGEDYADSLEAMRTLVLTHSVFNGSVGALTGEHALWEDASETVLMIHNQANRDSRAYLIDGHGDFVWESSFSDEPMTGMKAWFVCGGSAVAAMYRFKQPGMYAYVNQT